MIKREHRCQVGHKDKGGPMTAKPSPAGHTLGECSCNELIPEIHRFDLRLKRAGFTVSCFGCGRTTSQHKLKRLAIQEWNISNNAIRKARGE